MEVLDSTNRMSAITFLSFYFLVKMAPDHTFNYTGLAHHNSDRSFVTHLIFTTFLLLFMIPIRVQVVTICGRLHFYRWFSVLLKNYTTFSKQSGDFTSWLKSATNCRNDHADCRKPHQDPASNWYKLHHSWTNMYLLQ